MKASGALSGAVLLCCLMAGTWSEHSDTARLAVVRGNNIFSTDLYKELTKEPGNAFFSPLSVEVVLAMAWLGAVGRTANEIAASLHLPDSRQQVEEGFKSLMTKLQSLNGNVTLGIANKVYAQKDFQVKQEFKKSAEQNFLSEAQEVDFQNNLEEARKTINSWVDEKTRNKIKELFPSGVLNADTIMVLVNAIYFKGKWLKPFNEELTKKESFHNSAKESKDVQMMHVADDFRYGEIPELKAKVLQLPYIGETLSMVILLPNEIEGLSDLENKLARFDLTQIDNFDERKVIVSLPKFKLEKDMKLNEPLQKLGMEIMFSDFANFTNLASKPLKVSKVVQKSFLEVTEEGSEAAAATGVLAVATSFVVSNIPPAVFKADRPFLFFIREHSSGAVIFMGRFSTSL